jgi:hypothetical protein
VEFEDGREEKNKEESRRVEREKKKKNRRVAKNELSISQRSDVRLKGKTRREEKDRIWKVFGAVTYGESAGPLRRNGQGRVWLIVSLFGCA